MWNLKEYKICLRSFLDNFFTFGTVWKQEGKEDARGLGCVICQSIFALLIIVRNKLRKVNKSNTSDKIWGLQTSRRNNLNYNHPTLITTKGPKKTNLCQTAKKVLLIRNFNTIWLELFFWDIDKTTIQPLKENLTSVAYFFAIFGSLKGIAVLKWGKMYWSDPRGQSYHTTDRVLAMTIW